MHFVEQGDEVGLVLTAHHEVDDGGFLCVVVAKEFIRDVDIVFAEQLAERGSVLKNVVHLQPHYLLLFPFEDSLFA